MDAACRHLRDGRQASGLTPLCLVLQQPGCVGGAAVLRQIVASLAASIINQSTDQAGLVNVIFLGSEASARSWMHPDHEQLVTVVPFGIGFEPSLNFHDRLQAALRLHRSRISVTGTSVLKGSFVTIDLLSAAFDYFAAGAVLRTLQALQADEQVAGIATLMAATMHDQQELAMMRSVATCEVLLRPVSQLQADLMHAQGHDVHVEAITSTLRHSGRVRVDSALYEMRADGYLVQHKNPPRPPVMGTQALASTSAADTLTNLGAPPSMEWSSSLQAKYEKDAATGSMKLTLSQKEAEARKKVVLPFEHRGRSSLYAADDFKRYLPAAAGGKGKGGGKDGLGHILYVRDSDNDYDSDEDPDDDLDI